MILWSVTLNKLFHPGCFHVKTYRMRRVTGQKIQIMSQSHCVMCGLSKSLCHVWFVKVTMSCVVCQSHSVMCGLSKSPCHVWFVKVTVSCMVCQSHCVVWFVKVTLSCVVCQSHSVMCGLSKSLCHACFDYFNYIYGFCSLSNIWNVSTGNILYPNSIKYCRLFPIQ